jgi:hypothetical protein
MKTILLAVPFVFLASCQDQLDIANPNQVTPKSARTEEGIIALAQGALYVSGLQGSKFGNQLFGGSFNLHEGMGDVVGSRFAPGELYCPDSIILDDGSALSSINPLGSEAVPEKHQHSKHS